MTALVILLLAATLGCAATSPPPRPAGGLSKLDDMAVRDLALDHAFPWSAARRLTWRDFQGPPPRDGMEGAKTAYSLSTSWQCRGQTFDFRVIVAFRTRQSWVKAAVLTDSAQRRTILGHEQTHFDLAELHARHMREVFRNLVAPCRKTDAELGALTDRLGEEEKAEQRRYDADTNHGLLAARQAAWTLETRRRLAISPD
jgi:hypothetical protein